MTSAIKERSTLSYILLSIFTLGIYHIVFWTKISKEVNLLCEGDGKKTMKYVYVWLLNFVTLGIFGLVWKCKLANRLKENAARYDLKFSESGALIVVYSTVGIVIAGPIIALCALIKNFNAIAKGFNEYNGLEDPDAGKKVALFDDVAEV